MAVLTFLRLCIYGYQRRLLYTCIGAHIINGNLSQDQDLIKMRVLVDFEVPVMLIILAYAGQENEAFS